MGQVFQIGANRFQVRVEITNRGKRDFKSGQGFQIGPENAVLKIFWILRLKCSWFVLNYSGQRLCLFICCKTKKKNFLFWKNMLFTKHSLFAEKMLLYRKKSFILKIFLLKKLFLQRKIYMKMWKYIYLIWDILLCRKCLCYKQKINLS